MIQIYFMPVRDTSSLLKDGPKEGDIYTKGVIEEVGKNDPRLLKEMFGYIAKGAAEIYCLPVTLPYYLLRLTLLALAKRNDLNPSNTDIQVAATGIITNERVESYDRDINYTLFLYYLSLGLRFGGSTLIYYAANLLTDGRLANIVLKELSKLGIYIR